MSRVSRRSVLRGLGASVALPWLELFAPSAAHASTSSGPSRLLVHVSPNGMPMDRWRPAGPAWGTSPILAPLTRHADHVTIVQGTSTNPSSPDVEPHLSANLALLANSDLTPWHAAMLGRSYATMDRVAAAHLGHDTALSSLELGSEAPVPCAEVQSSWIPSCAGYATPSYDGPGAPRPRRIQPREVFDLLVGDLDDVSQSAASAARRRALDQSVLDVVLADVHALEGKLGADDRARLDRYLTSVREVEKQVTTAPPPPGGVCDTHRLDLLDEGLLDPGTDLDAHVRVMHALAVLALACDRTRVVSYALSSERTARTMPHLGIAESWHGLSHHGGDPAKLDALETIGTWQLTRFAGLLDQLADVPVGAGTLLDDTIVLFLCAISDPDVHDSVDLPVVVAGGHAGQGLVTSANEHLQGVHLAVLQRLGLPLTSFGRHGDAPALTW